MKTEIETINADVSRILRLNTGPAPSSRVPVTAANRALLRWLRHEELTAWEAGRLCHCGHLTTAAAVMSEPNHV